MEPCNLAIFMCKNIFKTVNMMTKGTQILTLTFSARRRNVALSSKAMILRKENT